VTAIRLLIDMDEVLCDFLGELCRQYNHLHGTDIAPADINQYDLRDFIGEEGRCIFLRAGFFDCLEPFPHAIEVIHKLIADKHDVIIATNALGHPDVAADKCRWLQRHLPELYPENVIIASRKELIQADLIFDDSPAVLNSFPGIRVIMDRPYNRKVQGYRIFNNSWPDFYSLVCRLSNR